MSTRDSFRARSPGPSRAQGFSDARHVDAHADQQLTRQTVLDGDQRSEQHRRRDRHVTAPGASPAGLLERTLQARRHRQPLAGQHRHAARHPFAPAKTPPATPAAPTTASSQRGSLHRVRVRLYEGGGFAFASYADESVFDLDLIEHLDPATNAAGCYIIVPDVDAWHARLTALGVNVTALEDTPWGMREFRLTDPSGNGIRFGRSLG